MRHRHKELSYANIVLSDGTTMFPAGIADNRMKKEINTVAPSSTKVKRK